MEILTECDSFLSGTGILNVWAEYLRENVLTFTIINKPVSEISVGT